VENIFGVAIGPINIVQKRKGMLSSPGHRQVSCYHYFACVGHRKPFTFTSSPLKPLSQNNRSCAFEYAGLRLKLDSTYSQNSLIKIVVQMELVGNLVPHKPANRLSITITSRSLHVKISYIKFAFVFTIFLLDFGTVPTVWYLLFLF
jgi:hypothetical protein